MPAWLSRIATALGGLADSTTLVGAALGALGALTYVLLTVLCTYVYLPLGVSPGDVGLGYGELLIRGGVGFAIVVAFGLVLAMIVAGLAWSLSRLRRVARAMAAVLLALLSVAAGLAGVEWNVVGAIGLALVAGVVFSVVIAHEGAKGLREAAVGVLLGVLALFAMLLIWGAVVDRGRLKDGEIPDTFFLGIPPPWDADVARVHWTDESRSEPLASGRCLLLLGEADGTTVVYDPTDGLERTLRVPTSAVLLEILPEETTARGEQSGGCE